LIVGNYGNVKISSGKSANYVGYVDISHCNFKWKMFMAIRCKEFCQEVYYYQFNTKCYVLFNSTTKVRAEWLLVIEPIGW